jgi:signal transduction histidine kinase/GAF domain-containing protein
MPSANSEIDLRTINVKLSDISLKFKEQGQSSTLKEFTRLARLLTGAHTCILIFVNLDDRKVSKIASSSRDKEFEEFLEKKREISLITSDTGIGVRYDIVSKGVPYRTSSLQTDGGGVINPEIAKRYGLNHFFGHPIKIDNSLRGYLNFFSDDETAFSEQIELLINIVSKCAEIPVHQYEIEKKHNRNLKDAIEEMAQVKGDNRRDQILKITLKYASQLLGKDNIFASVLKLDDKTGELVEVEANPPTSSAYKTIEFGTGYCSKALMKGEELIENIAPKELEDTYIDAWGKGTSSEMVIPLMIKNEQVRIRKETKSAFRPIGVLNFESQSLNEFTREDIDIILPLVSQASLLIDKLAMERKLSKLREVEKRTRNKDWKEALRIIAAGIQDSLGFELINISLVDYQRETIKTEVAVGLENEERTNKFIEMACHSLDGNDIQSSIVKNKEVEVPDDTDERFDKKIWDEFNHVNLIRVFVPIISPLTGKCIGTIDAGYVKGHRKYIYESDIKILQGFAELAVEAIEKLRANLLDKVFHEIQSPIAGIEGHTDILKRKFSVMSYWDIKTKFEDIELDCEILRQNFEEMKYFLGKPLQPLKVEEVKVMKDVVIKTIKQLRPRIEDLKFSFRNIIYDSNTESKIVIFTDPVKINQVVYNLLNNSVRYAEKNPNEFKIEVLADEDEHFFIIKFRDWGIGIKEEYREKIFEDYFRTPEAEKRAKGTGLGLPISRKIMRDIGGDIVLTSLSKPTEFQVKIPKRYKTRPKGFKN